MLLQLLLLQPRHEVRPRARLAPALLLRLRLPLLLLAPLRLFLNNNVLQQLLLLCLLFLGSKAVCLIPQQAAALAAAAAALAATASSPKQGSLLLPLPQKQLLSGLLLQLQPSPLLLLPPVLPQLLRQPAAPAACGLKEQPHAAAALCQV
jgi:hypothetical protein